jgi:hypothetical protein
MIAAYLIARTHNDVAPAYYLMATAVVSIGVLLTIPETAGTDIHAPPGEELGGAMPPPPRSRLERVRDRRAAGEGD